MKSFLKICFHGAVAIAVLAAGVWGYEHVMAMTEFQKLATAVGVVYGFANS